jgi:hypothetical protein
LNLPASTALVHIFKPVTRERWDMLTPLALVALGVFGVTFI